MTVLKRDRPFTQTTRRPPRRRGPHRARRDAADSRRVSAACWNGTTVAATAIDPGAPANHDGLAAGDGGGGELGSARRSHQAAAAGHPAREQGRCGGRAFSPLLPPRAAAPARLAAWSIGRAPHAGHPKPTDRGARDGAGRPTVVLPLGSQHRQFCRNPLEVIRPRPPRGLAWQNSAPDDRGSKTSVARPQLADELQLSEQTLKRRLGEEPGRGHPGRWEAR